MQTAVCTQQISVVGCADQDGVVRTVLGDCPAHPVHRPVDLGVQSVVQVAVALAIATVDLLDPGARSVPRVVRLPEGDLGGGFLAQILAGRRRRRDVWGVEW